MSGLEKVTKLSWIYDLYRLSQSMSPATLPNAAADIYQQILVHIVDGFGAKNGSLALCDENRKSLLIVAGIDLPAGVVGKTVPMGTGVLGWVAQQNEALLLNGCIADDSRFREKEQRLETEIPHSAVCWPLRLEEKVIGAVSVNRPEESPPYTRSDLEQGTLILNLTSMVLSNIQLHIAQQSRIEQLKQVNRRLEEAQNQLMQTEKMASIGQMAAGVAHEINNPIGFVSSNLGSLEKYCSGVFRMLEAYEKAEPALPANVAALAEIHALKRSVNLEFLKEDIPSLISESKEGVTRVKNIVQNLKDFSRVDTSSDWQLADVHQGLDSTIGIAWSQLKYKAEVVREYGKLPQIECLPSQLNQVFLNMLVNAGQAIEGKGVITVRTATAADGNVTIAFTDNGCGIPPEHLGRIFDPFFTTKKIGEGTGLGLSVSYGIVQKHRGEIEVASEVGKGTTFTIHLPIKHSTAAAGKDLVQPENIS